MQFLTLLGSGVLPESVAKRCCAEFVEAYEKGLTTFKNTCIAFGQECLHAIGIDCTIDPEDIISRNGILWPEDIHTYTFKYNTQLLAPFEKFLVKFCEEFYQEKITLEQGNDEEEHDDAIFLLVKIIVICYNIFKDLLSQESKKAIKQFEEPISRINFHFLLGVYSLRRLYRNELSLLDKLCDQLYKTAALGIRYPRSYLTIILGILEIFEKDFFLFYVCSKDVIYFFYNVLSLDLKTPCVLKMTFNTLKKMITAATISNDDDVIPSSKKIMILTDFLISMDMQRVYFTILKSRRYLQVLSCLDFLNVLQNSVLSLDCFSMSFLQGIQYLLLSKNAAIATAAAEVYMKMVLKKMTTGEIIKQIKALYLNKRRKFPNFDQYVKSLFPYFTTEMCVSDYYIAIIKEKHKTKALQLLSIKFVLTIFQQMLTEFNKHTRCITDIVNKLPYFLKIEACCYVKNLYLGFYHALFSKKRLPTSLKHTIYADLEKFTEREFNRKTPQYTYTYLHNVFSIYLRCLKFSNNIAKLDTSSGDHFRELDRVENVLQKLENEQKAPSTDIIMEYREILLKTGLYLKIGIDIFTDFLFLKLYYQKLWTRFSDSCQILTYAQNTQTFLDVYACEVLTFYLGHIAKLENISEYCRNWIIAESQKLFDLLMQHLQEAVEQPTIRFHWVKTLIVCSCGLLYKFGNPNRFSGLKYEIKQYHNLINNILLLTFKYRRDKTKNLSSDPKHCEELHLSQKRILEYQKEIFHNLILLHGEKGIKPPSSSIWKICINFGHSTHSFDEELEKLMKTLALYHFEEYKRIIAVSIYNLGRQYDANTIKRTLIAHKKFILSNLTQYNTKCLKVHIVVLVVQIVKETLQNIGSDKINRLRPLKYMSILLEDLDLNLENMQDVFQHFASLQKLRTLTSAEKLSLKKFLNPYENELMELNFITPQKGGRAQWNKTFKEN